MASGDEKSNKTGTGPGTHTHWNAWNTDLMLGEVDQWRGSGGGRDDSWSNDDDESGGDDGGCG